MTLKAKPDKMSSEQLIVTVLVGLSAVAWGAFGLADWNIFVELLGNYPTVQDVGYGAMGAAGVVFLGEIFTESEILDIID